MYIKLKRRITSGFTIVELLIVVVVIAILAAITIVAYNGVTKRAQLSAMQSSISQAVKKVQTYAIQNGDVYPATAADAGLQNSSSTTFQVSSNNSVSPQSYCVTVTINGLTYFQTSTMSSPLQGTCMGMLAWWPFNGDANDDSGNGVNGTVVGATLTTGTAGVANTAYQLGETSQYITMGTPSSFSSLPAQYTYSVWVSRTGTSLNQWPFIMGSTNTHINFGLRGNSYGANTYFEWGRTPFDGSAYSGSANSITPIGEWHNAVVTFDGSQVRSYWDEAQTSISGITSMAPTMAPFNFSAPTDGWPGKIDDARVYSRALSATEVQTLCVAGAY